MNRTNELPLEDELDNTLRRLWFKSNGGLMMFKIFESERFELFK
jgi:hypothetical protein